MNPEIRKVAKEQTTSLKDVELNADSSKKEAVYGMNANDIPVDPDRVKTSVLSAEAAGYAAM